MNLLGWSCGVTSRQVSVTVLGNPSMVTLTVVIALFLAIAAGHSRLALPIVASPIAAFLTGNLMKDLLRHPRPPDPVIPDPASYGFPSGHAATAAATWLTLALLAMRFESRPAARKALLCCGAAVAVLVGWSRIYIGVHYFSDVIGGWLLGTLWSLLLVDGQDVVTGMSKG